jgi:hypothetical protein
MEQLEGQFFGAYTRIANLAQCLVSATRQGAAFYGNDQIAYDDMKAKTELIHDRLRKINLDLSATSAGDALGGNETSRVGASNRGKRKLGLSRPQPQPRHPAS